MQRQRLWVLGNSHWSCHCCSGSGRWAGDRTGRRKPGRRRTSDGARWEGANEAGSWCRTWRDSRMWNAGVPWTGGRCTGGRGGGLAGPARGRRWLYSAGGRRVRWCLPAAGADYVRTAWWGEAADVVVALLSWVAPRQPADAEEGGVGGLEQKRAMEECSVGSRGGRRK